jgi:hypothetical protein
MKDAESSKEPGIERPLAHRRSHLLGGSGFVPRANTFQRALRIERPLIHARFKTDGVDLFVEQFGSVLNVTKQRQTYLGEEMREYLDCVNAACQSRLGSCR